MRKDMSKIITEPARFSVGYYRTLSNDYRRAKNFKFDEDLNVNDEFTARVLPIRGKSVGWEGKSHRFAYQTAKRFITSSVGRIWNDVYSEIAEICKSEAAKALDLRDIFLHLVEVDTYISDAGYICYRGGYHGPTVIESGGTFYVDPTTHMLCVSKGSNWRAISKKRREDEAAKRAETHRKIGDLEFEKIKGVWFHVRVEKIAAARYTRETNIVWKRTVSKADIRRYGLNTKLV
jgi:hypothetical protein